MFGFNRTSHRCSSALIFLTLQFLAIRLQKVIAEASAIRLEQMSAAQTKKTMGRLWQPIIQMAECQDEQRKKDCCDPCDFNKGC